MEFRAFPKTFVPVLDNDRTRIFRLGMRRFRLGWAEGAKGEPHDQFGGDFSSAKENLPPIEPGWFTEGALSNMNSVDLDITSEVTEFRIAYQRFRQGSHHGAKGETTSVAKTMTIKHARAMPAGQRSNMLAYQAKAGSLPTRPQTRFHVHFGAGRLGMGLLSPVIATAHKEGIPFCIVNDPVGDYEQLVQKMPEYVNFLVNGELVLDKVRLVVHSSQLPDDISLLLAKDTRLFICSSDQDLVRRLVSLATTLSTSLGPVLEKVISPFFLESKTNEKILYCCENDHGAVNDLRDTLNGRVEVVTCMVDRICTGRELDGNQIISSAEPHKGEIVILNSPPGAPFPCFGGRNVIAPASEAEASYFCRRKITMVNGMHTTLAFLTLCKKEAGNIAGDHELLTYREVIRAAHGGISDESVCETLIDYAKKTLKRFDTITDRTPRILGGGVANRWSTRLHVMQAYLESCRKMKGINACLLRMSRVDENDLRTSVRTLVDESERFVGQTPKWEM
eukprot:334127_1